MLVTIEQLQALDACEEGLDWFKKTYKEGSAKFDTLVKDLINEDELSWLNWYITQLLDKEDRVRYAIYAAELVLHIFEEKYPEDNRPKVAIEAAKKYLKNIDTACDAADAAYSAARDACDAADAAYSADADAANAAAHAAAYAARTARAANDAAAAHAAAYADAAADAAYSAADAAGPGKAKIYMQIVECGLSLIKQKEGK